MGRVAARVHTVLFRVALTVTVLFVAGAGALAVTQARLETVLSGSMSPTIPRNSLVLAVPVKASDLRVGDIVVFQPPAAYLPDGQTSVMHRIAELSDQDGALVMRTKGDANAVVDPWTIDLGGSAIHRVWITVPHVGVALRFLHNTTRHTGGALTWPGLLILFGAIAYAVRLRRQGADDADEPEDSDHEMVDEIWAAGRDILGCAEQLTGQDLDPKQLAVVRAIAEHAQRVTTLAKRLPE